MSDKDKNVTTVCDEDMIFIRAMLSLSYEKKILIKGIMIGLDIQDKQMEALVTQ